MKRIIYLTFYFEPDLCAGSFRNSPLALELAKQAFPLNTTIDIYTTLPNRYNSFNVKASEFEEFENVRIYRIKIPKHQSRILDQIKCFIIYYYGVLKLTKGSSADIVFVSSSRLFTSFLGYLLTLRFRTKFIIDVRDIFVDTIGDIVKNKLLKFVMLPFLKFIEARIFNSAQHINLISEGFKGYFIKFKCINYSNFTNGIDDEFLSVKQDHNSSFNSDTIKIIYAGNIGEGQGLHKVIPQAAQALGPNYEFIIIGDGGLKNQLENQVKKLGINNVKIIKPVQRDKLIEYYLMADYLFIHLNDFAAFEKVLPSKVFELATFNRFILAGVGGYAAKFIREEVSDSFVFKPCDADELVSFLKTHKINEKIERVAFVNKFQRQKINKDFAAEILKYL